MANTYTQLFVHFVFAVQNRQALISKTWKDELYKYITGIVTNKGHKLLSIGGVADHIHVLIGVSPNQSVSSLVADIKRSSSLWINERNLTAGKFAWQEGFGAFSYGKSQVHDVCEYIENQEEHHKIQSFRDEYIKFLELFGIDYNKDYIFY
ncbi:MAG: IS200/IS605 family transposase [Salinivirgaceae bacterium]|nr:IS200/IS605 family transposase [Salinivirgaceae bacterium]